MTFPRSAFFRALCATLVVSALSCVDGPTAPRPLALVTATPEALSLRPLDTATIAVRVTTLDGVEIGGRPLEWLSLDTSVATVDTAGLVTARAYTGPSKRNTAILVTTLGASTDTVPLEVLPRAVARVMATPADVTLSPRDSTQLTLRLESAEGIELSDRPIVWSVDDTAKLQVTPMGRLRARPYAGPLTRSSWVVGFSEGLADSVRVTVQALTPSSLVVSADSVRLRPTKARALSALVRSASGETLVDFPLQWRSTDTTVAFVNADGIVTATYYGGAGTRTAAIVVSHGPLADTTRVRVDPLDGASIDIMDVVPPYVRGGDQRQFGARIFDAAGIELYDRSITWVALDSAFSRVNASGLMTVLPYGGTEGRLLRFVARFESLADTVGLVLLTHAPAWLTATPEVLSLPPLDTATITGLVQSSDLTPLTGRTITFASLDTLVARVSDESGLVTATAYTGPAVRSTAIVLAADLARDTVPITVTPFAVARVIAARDSLTLAVGDSARLLAGTVSANGTSLTERTFAWVSGDTAVVRVSASGTVRARPYVGPLTRTTRVVVFSEGLADTIIVTVTPQDASSLQLSPSTLTLTPGGVDTLATALRSSSGELLADFPLTWTSTDTTVARVNAVGIVTASYYVGGVTRTALIVVRSGTLADTASVAVNPLTVAQVTISPDSGTLLPSATFQLDASLRDAAGLFLVNRTITWTSLNPAVATVDASGLVSAAAYGGTSTRTVQIIASSGGVADTATLTVPPHPVAGLTTTPEALSLFPLDTATIIPTVTALDLTVLSDRPVTWASLNTAVATVDTNGHVTMTAYTGPAVRSTAIVLTSAAATDTVPVSVSPFAVARVLASPAAVTLAPDDTTRLSLALESAGGIALSGRDHLWLSADTSIVFVDSLTGLVTARPYTGAVDRTVNVVVYSEGKADTVAVTISPSVPSTIAITPDTLSLFPGQQTTLAATLRSASDTVLVGRPITWTSADPAIASVNADGIVTGLFYVGPDQRTVNVIAANGVLADTALIRVRALLVDSLAIFPDTQTLQAEQTAQLSAVLRDAAGLFLTGRSITWSSSDTTLATVSDSGLVHALIAGTVTITASSGGISSQATITIVPVVTSVRVTPELATVWIGRTQPLTVALRDTTGAVPTGRRVHWTSSNPTRATVDSLGVVTALSTGLVTIRAISEGRSDSVRLDVFPEPSAAVTITFDDSWRGVLELAYPVLQDLRLRANVGWITNVNWAGVMNPTELRVLQDAGWSVVSHSMTHPFMTQISTDSALVELQGSRARIDSLGFDPRVFIAPYLDHNDALLAASASAGFTYTRCCAEDTWSTDTLVQWPIQPAARHRLAGVDVTNYDGQISSYNFRTVLGRDRLRQLLLDVVAEGKFLDVFFHDVLPEDVPDLRLTLEILAEFRPYLITYAMLP